MKLCADKQCRRAGIQLALSEFHRNRRYEDERNGYCRECTLRRVHEYRDRRREYRKAERKRKQRAKAANKPKTPTVPASKPMMLSPLLRVKSAVYRGRRTREEIQKSTRLSFDVVVDALAVLTFDHQSVSIVSMGEEKVFIPRAA